MISVNPDCYAVLHPTRFKAKRIRTCLGLQLTLKDAPMYIRALIFLLFLAQLVFAQQPTPILPDPKLTPGDTFDVSCSGRARSRVRQESASSASLA